MLFTIMYSLFMHNSFWTKGVFLGAPLYTWKDKAYLLEIIINYFEHNTNSVVLIISADKFSRKRWIILEQRLREKMFFLVLNASIVQVALTSGTHTYNHYNNCIYYKACCLLSALSFAKLWTYSGFCDPYYYLKRAREIYVHSIVEG